MNDDQGQFAQASPSQRDTASSVVLEPGAYADGIDVLRARLPSETAGALLGIIREVGGRTQTTITGLVPLTLERAGMGVAPSQSEWDELKAKVESGGGERQLGDDVDVEANPSERVVGWFYADPGIGIFPPRIDVSSIATALESEADLFMLVNPASDRGAFFRWQESRFVPVELPYEATEGGDREPTIPWNGLLPGAEEWLQKGRGSSLENNSNSGSALEWAIPETPVTELASGQWGRNRSRFVAGVVLAICITGALVGSLFLFGREGSVTTVASSTPTPSTIATSVALVTTTSSLLPAAPTPEATVVLIVPASPQLSATSAPEVASPPSSIATELAVPQPQATTEATSAAEPTPLPTRIATYTVASGDTLNIIAARFGTTAQALMAANNLKSTVIWVGQVLILPNGSGSGAGSVASATPQPFASASTTVRPALPTAIGTTGAQSQPPPQPVSTVGKP